MLTHSDGATRTELWSAHHHHCSGEAQSCLMQAFISASSKANLHWRHFIGKTGLQAMIPVQLALFSVFSFCIWKVFMRIGRPIFFLVLFSFYLFSRFI